MKKLLLALLVSTVVAGSVVASTGAYFTDVATSTNNVYAAGTLSLLLSNDNETFAETVTASFGQTNLKPGDVLPAQALIVRNDGTINGHHLDLEVTLDDNTKDLADAIVFGDASLKFGPTIGSDSVDITRYLHGTVDGKNYKLYDGKDGTDLKGILNVPGNDAKVSLQELADLGKIRIVPNATFAGVNAGTQGTLFMNGVVDTGLTTQGETVTATFTWNLDQDASQY